MIETKTGAEKKGALRPRLRNVLLVIQILLPFTLYIALEGGQTLIGTLIAGLIVLSMAGLVWVG